MNSNLNPALDLPATKVLVHQMRKMGLLETNDCIAYDLQIVQGLLLYLSCKDSHVQCSQKEIEIILSNNI